MISDDYVRNYSALNNERQRPTMPLHPPTGEGAADHPRASRLALGDVWVRREVAGLLREQGMKKPHIGLLGALLGMGGSLGHGVPASYRHHPINDTKLRNLKPKRQRISVAAQNRAAKKRRNIRARSSKRKSA